MFIFVFCYHVSLLSTIYMSIFSVKDVFPITTSTGCTDSTKVSQVYISSNLKGAFPHSIQYLLSSVIVFTTGISSLNAVVGCLRVADSSEGVSLQCWEWPKLIAHLAHSFANVGSLCVVCRCAPDGGGRSAQTSPIVFRRVFFTRSLAVCFFKFRGLVVTGLAYVDATGRPPSDLERGF